MDQVFLFDIKHYAKRLPFYAGILLIFSSGLFTGSQFNLSLGEGVFLNSPYTTGFMTGMLSLVVIFMATLFAYQLLFREWDSRFDSIIFTTPLQKGNFVIGRLLALITLTFSGFICLMAGFVTGQLMRTGPEMSNEFHLLYYLYPLLVFGLVNTLLVCSILGLIAWASKNKLLVAMGGLTLYVLYMITLLFSNSPFMAQSTPQSLEVQYISAIADPFGLSAYFTESSHFSMAQRNSTLVPLSGYFLLNRALMVLIAAGMFLLTFKTFSFSKKGRRRLAGNAESSVQTSTWPGPLIAAATKQDSASVIKSVFSFAKTDLIYLFKSTAIVVAAILLLFYTGMEMYAEIEKGIRLPQKYASSGLMASTINENFHLPGLLLIVYFLNDVFWRSHSYGFDLVENTTVHAKNKSLGHWISCSLLLLFFTLLLMLPGVVFQLMYQYPLFDYKAYAGVFVFNTLPLILLAGLLLLINRVIPNKYAALGVSLLVALVFASPIAKKVITWPLLRFLSGFNGEYSDFNGYGPYLASFTSRLAFGFCIIGILWLSVRRKFIGIAVLACLAFIFANRFMQGYVPVDKEDELKAAASYEKTYREYQSLPQPVITDVRTQVHLYPSAHRYNIEGRYVIANKSTRPIGRILVNFDEDLLLHKARYASAKERIDISAVVTELSLRHPLQAGDTASIEFEMAYQWYPVNGHHPFNAIIENGSFTRISRYYPQLGYQSQREIQDTTKRNEFGLGKATRLKKVNDPAKTSPDFINLDMTISTEQHQTAIGTGELVRHWQQGNRNYFQYSPGQPVPFRFAIASAAYKVEKQKHKGIDISVYYHPQHAENVQHLVENAKLTLDYCQQYFGKYPFHSISFAEVSSFTKGFAATAYPGTIFMTENMIFHANIKADQQQDVINELAGHELSHLWWGNNQIAPDDREGAAMLTETLAMYTEMMLYKRMHGREKMMERVKVHEQIYEAEKGFSEVQPLYKVTDDNPHIAYSKGAVAMVALSDLIGEDRVNEALRNFLVKHKYPSAQPVSTDLIDEILKISNARFHAKIRDLFMK